MILLFLEHRPWSWSWKPDQLHKWRCSLTSLSNNSRWRQSMFRLTKSQCAISKFILNSKAWYKLELLNLGDTYNLKACFCMMPLFVSPLQLLQLHLNCFTLEACINKCCWKNYSWVELKGQKGAKLTLWTAITCWIKTGINISCDSYEFDVACNYVFSTIIVTCIKLIWANL